jgi:hypothetical protein
MSQSLIVPRHVIEAMHPENCGACRFSFMDKGDLVCRLNPPTVGHVLVPAPPPRSGMVVAPFCSFPIIMPEQWCAKWTSKANGKA